MNLARSLLLFLIVVPGCVWFERDDDHGYRNVPAAPYYPPTTPTRSANQPDFGTTVNAEIAPPPISGGTLHVTKDGRTAIASDPDRDAIFVVDLQTYDVHTIALAVGDEPGRVA